MTGGPVLEEKSDQDHPQTVQITVYEFRLWPPHLVILLDLSYLHISCGVVTDEGRQDKY